ncbi:MAG: pyridine nucleotide transhydrogenase subunit alpha [Phycisphaerae bacterium]|jgi:NAD(P) transhydrogenase subunit alpha|nr:MAG: pyridine nucleotide transhydrogenase subunit alpha [Phycisphaerae bacterium]
MSELSNHLFVFLLAAFLGLEVIKRVSHMLHTPLMSLTNAISAISVIVAIELAGQNHSTLGIILGTIAVAAAMTNVVGGFLITERMLRMFRKREVK